MSLLQDKDYVLTRLRASYLQSFEDGVGLKVIRPGSLYVTKSGSRQLNGPASAIVSLIPPGSPPIPTDNLGERLHEGPLRRSRTRIRPKLDQIDPLKRKRASTLPSILSADKAIEKPAGHVTHSVLGSGEGDSDFEKVGSGYESIDSEEEEEEEEEDEEDDITGDSLSDSIDNDFTDQDDDSVSEDYFPADDSRVEVVRQNTNIEDDSDIEEDFEYVSQQIKRQGSSDPVGSIAGSASGSNVGDVGNSSDIDSPTTSRSASVSGGLTPRIRGSTVDSISSATQARRVPVRQQSLDVRPLKHHSSTTSLEMSSGRRLSIPSGSRPRAATTSSRSKSLTSSQQKLQQQIVQDQKKQQPNEKEQLRALVKQQEEELKEKKKEEPVFTHAEIQPKALVSKLSSQIRDKQATFDNPLEQYISASGRSESDPITLKLYMPSCAKPKTPWEVVVKSNVVVADAIGFALYQYDQLKREPALKEDMRDANRWNLFIVEEDGEPDEDFPALDRTRIISAFSFDEFALVEATGAQAAENDRKTPNKYKYKKLQDQKKAAAAGTSAKVAPRASSDLPPGQMATVHVFQYPFDEITSKVYWTKKVDISTTISSILKEVTQAKHLDNSYIFKIASTRILVAGSTTVEDLDGKYQLELTPERVITAENGYDSTRLTLTRNRSFKDTSGTGTTGSSDSDGYNKFKRLSAATIRTSAAVAAAANGASDPSIAPATGLVAQEYIRYTIWRRQPMSFISRHERTLAIDGEYVYIMPSEERTWFDSPKTSSFHISQIIKCKQSRKVPTNFKVVVMKTSGPKRYDLEATTAAIAAEIVAKLKFMAEHYKH